MDEFLCCKLCSEDFNEKDKKPHSLPCGHHFCAICLDNLAKRRRVIRCPTCRKLHRGHRAKDFPVNYGLQDVIEHFKTKATDNKINAAKKREAPASSEREPNFLENIKSLIPLCENMFTQMEDYKDVLCKKVKKHADVASEFEKLKTLNMSLSDKFKSEYDDLCKSQNEIENILKELKPKTLGLNNLSKRIKLESDTDVGDLFKKIMIVNNWLEDSTKGLPGSSLLISSKQTLEKSLNILSSWDSPPEPSPLVSDFSDTHLSILEKVTFLEDCSKNALGQVILKVEELSTNRGKDLCKNGKLYAVLTEDGDVPTQRHARISCQNEKYYLHCLKNGKAPEHAFVIKHDELIKFVEDKEQLRAFMNLRWDFTPQGRVIIKLHEPKRSKGLQFRILCTGDLGPSYRWSKFYRVVNMGDIKLEYIEGGDYEFNDGEGGRSVVDISSKSNKCYPNGRGAFVGHWAEGCKGAQFYVRTGDGDSYRSNFIFGQTEEGMEILKAGAQCISNNGGVFIEDCGVVLPI